MTPHLNRLRAASMAPLEPEEPAAYLVNHERYYCAGCAVRNPEEGRYAPLWGPIGGRCAGCGEAI